MGVSTTTWAFLVIWTFMLYYRDSGVMKEQYAARVRTAQMGGGPNGTSNGFGNGTAGAGPAVTIQFCRSVQSDFTATKTALEAAYPQLTGRITGAPYAGDSTKSTIASVVTSAQLVLLPTVLWGENIFGMLGSPVPPFLKAAADKKYFVVGGLVALNYGTQYWVSTGAFEVTLSDSPSGEKALFSKLESKRLPTVTELGELLSLGAPQAVSANANAASAAGGAPGGAGAGAAAGGAAAGGAGAAGGGDEEDEFEDFE
jgi:selT/selW/selH-like putative selenoprotein